MNFCIKSYIALRSAISFLSITVDLNLLNFICFQQGVISLGSLGCSFLSVLCSVKLFRIKIDFFSSILPMHLLPSTVLTLYYSSSIFSLIFVVITEFLVFFKWPISMALIAYVPISLPMLKIYSRSKSIQQSPGSITEEFLARLGGKSSDDEEASFLGRIFFLFLGGERIAGEGSL